MTDVSGPHLSLSGRAAHGRRTPHARTHYPLPLTRTRPSRRDGDATDDASSLLDMADCRRNCGLCTWDISSA